MDVLQKRIEAQRFELIQQKEGIQSALTKDVASLQERCERDQVQICDVYARYRSLLDDNSRARGQLSDAVSALQEHGYALDEFDAALAGAESAALAALAAAQTRAADLARFFLEHVDERLGIEVLVIRV